MLSTLLLAALIAPHQAVDSATGPAYRIVASLSPDLAHLDASAVVQLRRAAFGASDSVHLALGGAGYRRLHLTRAPLLGGRPVSFRLTPDSSAVVLPLPPEPTIAITVEYRITIDTTRRRQLGYDLFGSTESADSWYPTPLQLPDSVRRFSAFEVDLEAPADVAVLTSGTAADSTSGAVIHRRYRGEHLEGFTLALGRGYLVRTHPAGGVVVRALSPTADTVTWDRVAEAAATAARWYQRTYGFFPAHEIGLVPGSTGSRGGFPLPNLFMIHRGDLSPDFIRWITAHELAHYYWGLYVLSSGERLDWLMLGLGIWTDAWYLATTAGVSLEAQWRDLHADNSFEDFATALIAGYDQRLGLAEEEADALPYDYNSYVRHGKGSVGIYLLSRRLGAERFVDFQRALLREFRYRPLPPELFARRLEAAGVPGVAKFLQAWVVGDARLDYAVRGIRADGTQPGAYWIQIARTGTIPYPVTIEARPASGPAARAELAGEASLDSVRVVAGGALGSVAIDPDGLLPMWSSSNAEMRRVFLRAMGAVGPVGPFLELARSHLRSDPDPALAALVVERLFELGRFAEIQAVARQGDLVTRCTDRVSCLAAVQVARALWRMGAVKEAGGLLKRLDGSMSALGFGGSRRLAIAHDELRLSR
jgi:hypothetical protein